MRRTTISALVLMSITGSLATLAAELPRATPEEVGMSSERLTRVDEFMERHLDAHHFAGAVTLVARRGAVVQLEAYGMQDIEAGVPMSTDSIFRIYSMTKPITSVAVMVLFEEGRFLLSDPIGDYLPELADLAVGVETVDEATGEKVLTTEPALRPITIRDLLRHTSGFTYGFFGDSMVDAIYREKGVISRDATLQETVAKLATIPLKHQPGTVWEYSVSNDVLARFVEVVSGQRFDRFLHDRIFAPLTMNDTGFFVPPDKVARLTQVYTPNQTNTALAPTPLSATVRDFTKEPTRFAGLVSTAPDYLRFAEMILNGGELDGVRILGPRTVALMTRDHLRDIPIAGGFGPFGFGLGFMVSRDQGESGSIRSEGSLGWGGVAHTNFWIDPAEQLIGVFMTQILPTPPIPYRQLFEPVVYQAIVD